MTTKTLAQALIALNVEPTNANVERIAQSRGIKVSLRTIKNVIAEVAAMEQEAEDLRQALGR